MSLPDDPPKLARFLTAFGYSTTEVAMTIAGQFPGLRSGEALELAQGAHKQQQESNRQLRDELDRDAVAAEFDLSKSTNDPPEIR